MFRFYGILGKITLHVWDVLKLHIFSYFKVGWLAVFRFFPIPFGKWKKCHEQTWSITLYIKSKSCINYCKKRSLGLWQWRWKFHQKLLPRIKSFTSLFLGFEISDVLKIDDKDYSITFGLYFRYINWTALPSQ